MPLYSVTARYRTFTIMADDEEHAILTFAEIAGLVRAANVPVDIENIRRQCELEIEEIEE